MAWASKFMGRLWTRQKPDGKSGWGALRYLLLGFVFLACGYWTVTSMDHGGAKQRASSLMGSDNSKKANPLAQEVRTSEVAAAAQDTRPVDIQGQQKEQLAGSNVGMGVTGEQRRRPGAHSASYFGEPRADGAGNSSASQFTRDVESDSIFTALSRSEQPLTADGRPVIDESQPSAPTRRESSFDEPYLGGNSRQNPQLPPIEALVARNVRPPSTPTVVPDGSHNNQQIMPATHWLPRGEIIPVFLMQTVQTGRIDTLIEFAVAKTVWFNGKPVLPFGTRFTATVTGSGVRDRIPFNIDSVRRRDGLEIAVNGMVLGPDRFSGLPAYYVPPPKMAQLAPYIGDFASSFADIIRGYAANSTNTSVTVGNVNVSSQTPPMSEQLKQASLYASAKAISEFMATQVTEIQERYAAYLIAPAGSIAYVQLKSNTDLSSLWDEQPRGQARTVGTVEPISTEQTYIARQSAAKPSAEVPDTATSPTLGTSEGSAVPPNSAGTVRDPLSQ